MNKKQIISIGIIVMLLFSLFAGILPFTQLEVIEVVQASPDPGWWDASWDNKRELKINNTGGGALSYYQVYVNLSSTPINETSLRVVNETADATVPHWCENETGGDCYALWFNATAIPASSWLNDTYYIYYNSTGASSTSNIVTTFVKGDDFSGDLSNWTITAAPEYSIKDEMLKIKYVSTNIAKCYMAIIEVEYIYEFKSNITDTTSIFWMGATTDNTAANNAGSFRYYDDGTIDVCDQSGTWHDVGSFTANTWRLFRQTHRVSDGKVDFYVEGVGSASDLTDANPVNYYLIFNYNDAGAMYMDDWRIRKRTLPEPDVSIGSEESGIYVPKITSISLSPVTVYYNNTLRCNATIFVNIATGNVSYEWYKNDINQTSLAGAKTNVANNTDTEISNVSSSYLNVSDVWYCKARVYDGTNISSWNSSSTKTIQAYPPTVTLNSPPDNTTSGLTTSFVYTPSDELGFKKAELYIELSNITKFGSGTILSSPSVATAFVEAIVYQDVNDSDSLPDLFLVFSLAGASPHVGYCVYYPSNASSATGFDTGVKLIGVDDGSGMVGFHNIQIIDLNSDGLMDALFGTEGTSVRILYGNASRDPPFDAPVNVSTGSDEADYAFAGYVSNQTYMDFVNVGENGNVRYYVANISEPDGYDNAQVIGTYTGESTWVTGGYINADDMFDFVVKYGPGGADAGGYIDLYLSNASEGDNFNSSVQILSISGQQGCGDGTTVYSSDTTSQTAPRSDINSDNITDLMTIFWNATSEHEVWIYLLTSNSSEADYYNDSVLVDTINVQIDDGAGYKALGDIIDWNKDGILDFYFTTGSMSTGTAHVWLLYGNQSESDYFDDAIEISVPMRDYTEASIVVDVEDDGEYELVTARRFTNDTELTNYAYIHPMGISWEAVATNITDITNNSQNSISYTFTAEGNYTWNIKVTDTHDLTAWGASNWTVNITTLAATTPSISNVTTGSINATSQWVAWDVNQTAHNRWKYSLYENMSYESWSSWDNSTASPNITVTTLTENTKYYYQTWSYNTTNTSLTDNSTTANFTTPAAPPVYNYIYTGANEWYLLRQNNINQTHEEIANNLTNVSAQSWCNDSSGEWVSYWVGYDINKDVVIHKHYAIMPYFTSDTMITCDVLPAESVVIPSLKWYYTSLRESTSYNLTTINTSITSDGCVISAIYAYQNDTGLYNNTGSYPVDPNEGEAIYATTGCVWDGSV